MSQMVAEIRSRFTPYFTIKHPTKGVIPGPIRKIPIPSIVWRLALDVVVVLAAADLSSAGEIMSAVDQGLAEEECIAYWHQLRSCLCSLE